MTRLKTDEIREKFDPAEVTAEDATRQAIAKLTHGRLSHGPEINEAYFHMKETAYSSQCIRGDDRTYRSGSDRDSAAAGGRVRSSG